MIGDQISKARLDAPTIEPGLRVCMLAYTFYETDGRVIRYEEALARHGAHALAGFMRSEEGLDGALHYSTIHNDYRWDVHSACRRQGETFVRFTNNHSACDVLTRDQLRRVIASGGFCVPPHQGRHDLLAPYPERGGACR